MLLGIVAVLSLLANLLILSQRPRVFSDITRIPAHRVGLVLGASRNLPDGTENWQCTYRIHAAVALFRAGKVSHLLISGDNHVRGYDEPSDIRASLLAAGIPAAAITCDYAGFRTFDSIVRAQRVFGLRDLTIISQRYHDYRALAIARHYGLDAVAFTAEDVPGPYRLRSELREYLARSRACIDLYLWPTRPHFLGPQLPL